MILNIIDRRKKPYKWKEITAIFEPTCHDNSVKDSDFDTQRYEGIGYHEIANCSLSNAMHFASQAMAGLTVYLYDLGEGIKISERGKL
jgi:hypothetical protein